MSGRLARLAPETVLLVSGAATALGQHLSRGSVQQIASYVLAAVGGIVAAKHTPAVKRAVKKTVASAKSARRPTPAAVKLPAFGLDYSYATLTPKQLQQAGVKFVCRYLSPDPGKNLSVKESQGLGQAGIRRLLVWESTATRALLGAAAGVADARAAIALADQLGAPAGAAIYLAIDFEAAGPDVEAYFAGARTVLLERLGAYGGYTALAYLTEKRLICYRWQTYAWSGGRWLPNAEVLQYDINRELFGEAVDFNHVVNENCGWW